MKNIKFPKLSAKTKRICKWSIAGLIVVLAGAFCWSRYFSTTDIAFVNYQVISLGQISKANTNSFIKIHQLDADNLDDIASYDMVFINGMGLRITEEQREALIEAANDGTPVLTTAATNPDNFIVSLDSLQTETIKSYLMNGGRKNYRSMLNYIRQEIDGKKFFNKSVDEVILASNDKFYHPNIQTPDEENDGFNTIAEYNKYLIDNDLLKDGAPRIVICGQMGDATDLILALEKSGNVVYPVNDILSLVKSQDIDSIAPSAIINMAHGRLGDMVVNYLTRQNIPLFSPLNVNRLQEDWEEDKMGMSGGFMSQSIVTPEIDGAIRPYTLFGHKINEEGLAEIYTFPERLETFVETVNNYLDLQKKPNAEKKIAIVYFKGPGQNALTASGLEVVPSLYNFLLKLKSEGYKVENLPSSAKGLEDLINVEGPVFGSYSEGAIADFMENGNPLFVSKDEYDKWADKTLQPAQRQSLIEKYGEFPGEYMSTVDGKLAVARVDLGNVVLIPQTAAGGGDNSFQMVHGTEEAPPYSYIAPYLWAQNGFGADALIHFGTHGSLEYTPRHQVALSHSDWSDRLVGSLPHLYAYTIGNVGEAMIAKRRSYAGIQSYLTAPFLESSLHGTYAQLSDAINQYINLLEENNTAKLNDAATKVTSITKSLGIARELGLDSLASCYNESEISRIEQFAEELVNEKIVGQLYVMGQPYESARINSSIFAMSTDPIAYGKLSLDKLKGRATADLEKHKSRFTASYLNPAHQLVGQLLNNPSLATDELICRYAGITQAELDKAREIERQRNAPKGMMAMMMAMAGGGSDPVAKTSDMKPVNQQRKEAEMRERMKKMSAHMSPEKALALAKKMGAPASALEKMEAAMKGGDTEGNNDEKAVRPMVMSEQKEYSKEEVNLSMAIMEVERAIKNVNNYKQALLESPQNELTSLINALNGGFTAPSPGGDPIVNPNALPTGRNLYGINAEATPSESAWEKGKALAENTIRLYRERHNDSIPRKVSYTLWSGEFIETGGATIAQVLYMLGVEPIRDAFGRVTDLRLIPSKELGRPRIDVVVQTSGQLRDLAASRLFLINRAVEMASQAGDDEYENQVAQGVVDMEKSLTEKGISPKEAREIATYRVFGGVNGNYGTGIQGMIQSSDKWESDAEISNVYINNMGAFYGSEENWEKVYNSAFESALGNTDVVIQPRQSNTWGALSLDHVYEFMGGLNMAVRNVTGKDPDAYLSDYRNRNNMRMQEVKEAIGVESRATIFNPAYIKEKMKGEASSASEFSEIVNNTFGWNVAKPEAIDNEMWDEIYNVYVDDKFDLEVRKYFESKNPAALQDMSATMLESARKGMWKASEAQLASLAQLHAELVAKYGASGSERVLGNEKLQKFIGQRLDANTAQQYQTQINRTKQAVVDNSKGTVMKKEEMTSTSEQTERSVNSIVIIAIVIAALIGIAVMVRRRRKADK